jgi:hypothetical protein
MKTARDLELRRIAVNAIRTSPIIADWAFEFTPASPSNAIEGYERAAETANIIVFLVTDAISDPVQREVRLALRGGVPVLALDIRRGDDDVAAQAFIDELGRNVKYKMVTDDELSKEVKLAIGDLLKDALRAWRPATRRFFLAEQHRETLARILCGFEAPGLDPAAAERLAFDPSVGARNDITCHLPLTVLEGDVGAGKSLFGERWYARALQNAMADSDAAVPCRLKAAEVDSGRIVNLIDQRTEKLGRWRETGVALFCDGLDEPGVLRVEPVIQELRLLTRLSPRSMVLATTRPSYMDRTTERIRLQPLSLESAHELISVAARREIHLHSIRSLESSLRETIRFPLFALIFGVLLSEREQPAVQDRVSLLDVLVERALGRGPADVVAASASLRRLAVTMLNSGAASVAANSVSRTTRAEIVRSRLVREDESSNLTFSLPALVDWFGSEAIRDGDIALEELLSSEARIHVWRYPLAVAVVKSSHERAEQLLSQLFDHRPASAAGIVVEAFDQYGCDGIGELPDSDEATREIRAAYDVVQRALGPLRCFSHRENEYVPFALRAHTTGRSLEVEYFPPPSHFAAGFSNPFHAVAKVDTRPGWAFRYVVEEARNQLVDAIEKRALWLEHGPEPVEWRWSMAWQYADDNGVAHLRPLRETLQSSPRGTSLFNRSGTAGILLDVCDEMIAEGRETFEDPYPGYRLWTIEELTDNDRTVIASRVKLQIENALQIYRQMVEAWFPPAFYTALNLYRLFPVNVKVILSEGFLKPTQIWARHEIVPAEPGASTTVSVIVGSWVDEGFERMQATWRENQYARGDPPVNALSWFGVVRPFADRPATELAYTWLRNELKELSWLA